MHFKVPVKDMHKGLSKTALKDTKAHAFKKKLQESRISFSFFFLFLLFRKLFMYIHYQVSSQ